MRARRSIAAGLLTAAAFSTTLGGLAIMGSLDQASASSPVSPPVSQPQNPGQNGQNPAQNGQNQTALTLADLDGGISGNLNGSSLSATNLAGNAAGAAGTETLQTGTFTIEGFSNSECPANPLMNTCVDVSGTFTITTSVGTLSGTLTGGVGEDISSGPSGPQIAPVDGELALTVTSGTGQFASATGTLDAVFTFPGMPGSVDFTGTITAT
jgi:hypothetical protein